MSASKHNLKDLVIKLNDRNIQRQRESGLTLYAVLAVIIYILIFLIENTPIFIHGEYSKDNLIVLTLIGDLAFVIAHFSILLARIEPAKATKIFPNSDFLNFDISSFPLYLFLVFFSGLNFYLSFGASQNLVKASYLIFSVVLILNFLTPIVIELFKWKKSRGEILKVPHFTYLKSKERKALKTGALIGTIPWTIILIILIFNQGVESEEQMAVATKYSVFLLGLLACVYKFIGLRESQAYHDSMEDLEKDIYLKDLSNDEIKERLEQEYFGQDFIVWADRRKLDINKHFNTIENDLSQIQSLIPTMEDLNIELSERQKMYLACHTKREELVRVFNTYDKDFVRQVKHLRKFSSIEKLEEIHLTALEFHYMEKTKEFCRIDSIVHTFFVKIENASKKPE